MVIGDFVKKIVLYSLISNENYEIMNRTKRVKIMIFTWFFQFGREQTRLIMIYIEIVVIIVIIV